MKRNIEIIIVAILLCIVFTKALFSTYQQEQVMTMDGNIYLLQYGSYINEEVMKENIKKLDNYMIYQEENKYYVFIGGFINLENALKLQKIYENKGIYTYIKNDYIADNKIINEIEEIDFLALETNNDEAFLNESLRILNILKNIKN